MDEKTRKKRTRQEYKYDKLITAIRTVVPCNRTVLREIAVEEFINSFRDEETERLENEGIAAIAKVIQEKRNIGKITDFGDLGL